MAVTATMTRTQPSRGANSYINSTKGHSPRKSLKIDQNCAYMVHKRLESGLMDAKLAADRPPQVTAMTRPSAT